MRPLWPPGIVGGRPELELEVLSQVTPEEIKAMCDFLDRCPIKVALGGEGRIFYINVTVIGGGHSACCEIMDFHTNITRVMRDEQILFQAASPAVKQRRRTGLFSMWRRSFSLLTAWTWLM